MGRLKRDRIIPWTWEPALSKRRKRAEHMHSGLSSVDAMCDGMAPSGSLGGDFPARMYCSPELGALESLSHIASSVRKQRGMNACARLPPSCPFESRSPRFSEPNHDMS